MLMLVFQDSSQTAALQAEDPEGLPSHQGSVQSFKHHRHHTDFSGLLLRHTSCMYDQQSNSFVIK